MLSPLYNIQLFTTNSYVYRVNSGDYNTHTDTDSSYFLNGKKWVGEEKTIAIRKRVTSCRSHNDLLCLLTSEAPWQLGTSDYQGRSIESKMLGELLGEGRKLRGS